MILEYGGRRYRAGAQVKDGADRREWHYFRHALVNTKSGEEEFPLKNSKKEL